MIEILQKYNAWGSTPIRTGHPRPLYTDAIAPYMGNPLIKVLLGQRRSGKSYLMRQLLQSLLDAGVPPQNTFYLNKELIAFDSIRTAEHLHALIQQYREHVRPTGKVYIFLDEVQEITSWEKVVNSLAQDHVDQYEMFITGSNAHMLSSELTTLLSGRYIPFEVLPLSFAEYCSFHQYEHNKISYLSYIQEGGLPELHHLPTEETRRHYLSSLMDTILLKDIVTRFTVRNPMLLRDTFLFLADNIGNLYSHSSLQKFLTTQGLAGSIETFMNYITHLTEAYLLHEVSRYDIKGKHILTGPKKYYLNDLSFKKYLSSSFDPWVGKSLENLVYLHYRRQGYHIHVGTIGPLEVDFVLEKNGTRTYVQVTHQLTSPEVIEREFGNLEKIKDHHEKIVVSLDDLPYGNRNGIRHLRAWEL